MKLLRLAFLVSLAFCANLKANLNGINAPKQERTFFNFSRNHIPTHFRSAERAFFPREESVQIAKEIALIEHQKNQDKSNGAQGNRSELVEKALSRQVFNHAIQKKPIERPELSAIVEPKEIEKNEITVPEAALEVPIEPNGILPVKQTQVEPNEILPVKQTQIEPNQIVTLNHEPIKANQTLPMKAPMKTNQILPLNHALFKKSRIFALKQSQIKQNQTVPLEQAPIQQNQIPPLKQPQNQNQTVPLEQALPKPNEIPPMNQAPIPPVKQAPIEQPQESTLSTLQNSQPIPNSSLASSLEPNSFVPIPRAPSILILSPHEGTISELLGVCKSLFADFEQTKPTVLCSWMKMSPAIVKNEFCAKYSVILVSDAMAYVPFVLDEFANSTKECSKNWLIMNITNRFDVTLKTNRQQYLNTMKKLAANPRVIWAPNNPFELEWLTLANIQFPPSRTFICLPVGHSVHVDRKEWPAALKSAGKKIVAVQTRPKFWKFSLAKKLQPFPEFKNNSWSFEEKYGGASALREKFDWFLYIPYQFSTMKVFEMIRDGPVMVVPSAEFFKKIFLEVGSPNFEYAGSQMQQCITRSHPKDWERFFDVYYPKCSDMSIKFHSWEQLREWLRMGKIPGVDLQEFRKKVAQRMKEHELEQLIEWKKVFSLILK